MVRVDLPPPIPRVRSTGLWDQAEHLLLWVRTGSACVLVGNNPEFRLTSGQGVWIPAEAGNHWTIVTEPGTVAFPLLTHPSIAAEALSEPRRFVVPDGWQDWLIQNFNLMITPLASHGHSQDALADLLRRPGTHSPEPVRTGNTPPCTVDPPIMPKAGAAREVADELLRNPALDLTVAEWAERVLSSPRTLLRDFRADTGLSFEQWRLRCRLNAAVEYLAAGYGAGRVAARVGFATPNGFARAFKQQYGQTPHEFGRDLSVRPVASGLTHRAVAARQADDLMRIVRAETTPAVPDMLPAARTPSHTNNVHVLIWTYRGSGYLDIGDHRYEQERGVATWIPAGSEHTTGVRENSISLPLGNAGTGALQLTAPLRAQFSPAWDDYLLFCSISARTPVRPDDYDPGHILDLFADQVAAQRALSVPMPADPRARAAAMNYLRSIGTSGGSELDVPAGTHQAFREQTGMSFARWRYAARMRISRDLLAGGAKPSAVARRVGYAHLPTFSAAFTRFHGLSPRDYLAREFDRRGGHHPLESAGLDPHR
ncbi:AraC-like DNA-binding protein [Actinoplanes lutulentus]|uniref:AraC-like DNA-binding protein n=1 Tax=Actinoplanes lutulentus TaxID=1287878 RepID=A0A327ZCM9_9ACTN|nr:AraC family transcriptional regulator [Actinoplanes lutulentus]MBB2947211.1 AraC-like DNA-binding protein [Actinoplanes lutulentus]RAK36486.1 AraC-like DNA-binding protein [Actinoplanes lutulentus]